MDRQSYDINPFIDPGSLALTACNIQQTVELFRARLEVLGPGEDLELDYDERCALGLILFGMKKALGHLMEELT